MTDTPAPTTTADPADVASIAAVVADTTEAPVPAVPETRADVVRVHAMGMNLDLDLLKRTLGKDLTDDEFMLFAAVCNRTGLDPFAKQIYAIKRRGRLGIQTSIDGFRLIAERSGRYAGQAPIQWCAALEHPDDEPRWVDVWLRPEPPAAARAAVYKAGFAEPLARVATWGQYVQLDNDGKVTAMWQKMGPLMLGKCAEALALRAAFPAELSGLYTDDEMMQADRPGYAGPTGHGSSVPATASDGDRPLCEADPDLCADLRVRLDAIATVPAAREALVTMWRAGDNALPPFDDLQARHRVRALAMIQGVEGRLRKGEWGAWAADPTTPDDGGDAADGATPPDAPQDGPTGAVAGGGDDGAVPTPDDGEGVCGVCGAPDGADHNGAVHDIADAVDAARASQAATPPVEVEGSGVDEAALAAQVIAEVKALTKGAVVRELATRGFQTSRDDNANRRALGAVLLRERGGNVRDDQMPPRLPDPDPAPTPPSEPIPLAPADRAAGAEHDG